MNGQPISKQLATDQRPAIDKYFKAVIKVQGSDLHLKGDSVPRIRSKGSLRETDSPVIPEKQLEEMIFAILSEEQREFFLSRGALDFAYDFGATDRFRVNIFRQRGKVSLVARRISSIIPKFESLNLHPSVEKIADMHQGLILVTGVTGSGKSTTIASMLDRILRSRACHVITIEDPIEFIFQDGLGLVNQREVGIDVTSFDDALRSMMREDPDVILVGEIRDYTTLNAAIKAAETGHQVFGTLHSTDAYQSIVRMLDLTPDHERHMVRQALVGNLTALVAQRLIPTVRDDIPRVPALEILVINASARKLIADGREVELPTVIRSCYAEGMIDFNESLRQFIQKEFIDLKTAYNYSPNPEELKMAMKGIRSSGGSIIG
ncbi:MAG: PilT/PilU family type 4a pilus ATPase [Sedimentisphaerales bacterium]|nr:PilT/PilU family type 4a pilus ATPase [Sedimentisphaerales bacterium]MBN2842521.1 PilT/PilU family type 4a pilus ATPase [Sedimentisphaerales bacterium]